MTSMQPAKPDLLDTANVYLPSEDIVSREIEGELILIPIVAGIGDVDDDIFSFNDVARDIWRRFDGNRSLDDIIQELAEEYEAPIDRIKADVIGWTSELLRRKMLVQR